MVFVTYLPIMPLFIVSPSGLRASNKTFDDVSYVKKICETLMDHPFPWVRELTFQ